MPASRNQPTTIRDVARQAGVSLGTVSRVLNGKSSVSADIRDRVEQAIQNLGYAPNAAAQSMRSRATRTVGCVIRDINIPALASFVRAAHDALHDAGYALLLTNSEGQRNREVELMSILARRKADALIIAHHSEDDEALHETLRQSGVPIVLVDREQPAWADAVMVDHRGAVRRATERLFLLGHRRIALITGNPVLFPSRERIGGFEAAHAAHGIDVVPELVRKESFLADYAFQQTSILMSIRDRPSAIIAGGIDMLPGVLRALRTRGISIPNDVSVIAACDSDLAQLSVPPISVEHWDYAEIGRIAAQLVVERINGAPSGEPRRVLVPAEFIHRESCGPAPVPVRRAASPVRLRAAKP